MSAWISRMILRMFGWRVEGTIPETLKKYIVIAAPHTSWWDFFLGLLSRSVIRRKVHFLGKNSLFQPPLGWIMRALGGYPVDRSKHTKLVDQVIEMFRTKDAFAIALAPEGTRKKVQEFKTGFYFIARGAGVPIICATLDYGHKKVSFAPPFYPTEDTTSDLRTIWNHFVGVRGKHPSNSITGQK